MDRNPLAIQELVNHCIDFLCDSMPDLMACALVSCSWLHQAQSHIFREISIAIADRKRFKAETLWGRLQQALQKSPHLIRHIRRLNIRLGDARLSLLSQICNFPFTYLEHAHSVFRGKLDLQAALSLQQLLSLPTPRILNLTADWPLPDFPDRDIEAAIPLASLMISTAGSLDHRLLSALRLFTVTHLKALMIQTFWDIRWHGLAPALNTIEILSIIVQRNHMGLDLSQFPRLSVLRIVLRAGTMSWLDGGAQADRVVAILSTIRPEHRIHTVVITMYRMCSILSDTGGVLDDMLFSLCLPIELQVWVDYTATAAACLPRLRANHMLRVVPHNPRWWEDTIEGL
ncbi:hypothetical protein B0H19DRAFT_1374268 [Mycena capillaripes]|nr:hypothetical protein B0H19DRAFT_1374268 [Mycena capillaripes]